MTKLQSLFCLIALSIMAVGCGGACESCGVSGCYVDSCVECAENVQTVGGAIGGTLIGREIGRRTTRGCY